MIFYARKKVKEIFYSKEIKKFNCYLPFVLTLIYYDIQVIHFDIKSTLKRNTVIFLDS